MPAPTPDDADPEDSGGPTGGRPSREPSSARRPEDPRMRGFRERAEVGQVFALLRQRVRPLGAELSAGEECEAGRVLAADFEAPRDVPSFDRAAMDGLALRAADTFGADERTTLSVRVLGDSFPARPFDGVVGPEEAVRIRTGAPLPEGADAVLPAELCRPGSDGAHVELAGSVPRGKHVGRRGEDVTVGTVVLRAGRRLRPQDLGLLSSLGIGRVPLVRRPRVAILITGDEVGAPFSPPATPWAIADANGPLLRALVARDGGQCLPPRHAGDAPDAIRAALRDVLEEQRADAVLVSGGSSVGSEDWAPAIVAEHGELAVHGVAMRPSSPTGVGFVAGRPVFLLPGNPVSCLAGYEFFAGPAIRVLGGRSPRWPHARVRGVLRRKIASEPGRVDYVRVAVDEDGVEPLAVSGASILSSTTRADGAVIVPQDREGIPAGVEVTVLRYDDPREGDPRAARLGDGPAATVAEWSPIDLEPSEATDEPS